MCPCRIFASVSGISTYVPVPSAQGAVPRASNAGASEDLVETASVGDDLGAPRASTVDNEPLRTTSATASERLTHVTAPLGCSYGIGDFNRRTLLRTQGV